MRYIRLTRLGIALAALVALAVLAGCGSTGVGDILGGGSPSGDSSSGTYDNRDNVDNVRGTIARVDTLNRRIVVDREGNYNGSYLRNGDDNGTVTLNYDDRTTVQYQGKSFRPQDLESGDRILADVRETSGGLLAEDIEVLQDVSSTSGTGSSQTSSSLRGTISYVDTRNLTLEIDPSGSTRFQTDRSGVVLVHYDSSTPVEYQGRSYRPENLERGDEVEIRIRDLGSRLVAEDIVVVRDAQGS
jgi:hypothetical protein